MFLPVGCVCSAKQAGARERVFLAFEQGKRREREREGQGKARRTVLRWGENARGGSPAPTAC